MARWNAGTLHAAEHDSNIGLANWTSSNGCVAKMHHNWAIRTNKHQKGYWYANAAGGQVHNKAVEITKSWILMAQRPDSVFDEAILGEIEEIDWNKISGTLPDLQAFMPWNLGKTMSTKEAVHGQRCKACSI